MRARVLLAGWLLGLASAASAQTTDGGFAEALSPSMAAVVKAMHATIRRNIAEAAEAMPARDYVFQATSQVRTFGALVGHLINANFLYGAHATAVGIPGQ